MNRAKLKASVKGEERTGGMKLTRPPTSPRHAIIQTALFETKQNTLWAKRSVCPLKTHDLAAIYLGQVGAVRVEEEGAGLGFALGLGEEGHS